MFVRGINDAWWKAEWTKASLSFFPVLISCNSLEARRGIAWGYLSKDDSSWEKLEVLALGEKWTQIWTPTLSLAAMNNKQVISLLWASGIFFLFYEKRYNNTTCGIVMRVKDSALWGTSAQTSSLCIKSPPWTCISNTMYICRHVQGISHHNSAFIYSKYLWLSKMTCVLIYCLSCVNKVSFRDQGPYCGLLLAV